MWIERVNLVTGEIYCNFMVLKCKELQTGIAKTTEDKVTELFHMADDFCKFFDSMMAKYTLKPVDKGNITVIPRCPRQEFDTLENRERVSVVRLVTEGLSIEQRLVFTLCRLEGLPSA